MSAAGALAHPDVRRGPARPGSVPSVAVAHVVVDAVDLDRSVRFWSELLDLPVTRHGDGWADLAALGDGGPVLAFQRVPESKTGKNRLHLDLAVADIAAAGDHAFWLGAEPVSEVRGEAGAQWRVWRDPEGNEFCLLTA